MAKQDDILEEVRFLKVKLYGENGFEGDIPEIKKGLGELAKDVAKNKEHIAINSATLYGHGNNNGLVKQVASLTNRYWKQALIISALSATIGAGLGSII